VSVVLDELVRNHLRPETGGDTDSSAISPAPLHQKAMQLGTLESPTVLLLKGWSRPAAAAIALLICAGFSSKSVTLADSALAIAAALLSRGMLGARERMPGETFLHRLMILLLEWGSVVLLLGFLGYAFKIGDMFRRETIACWVVLTPLLLLVGDFIGGEFVASALPTKHRYIIIGANDVGAELARRTAKKPGFGAFFGFFDYRSIDRLPQHTRAQIAGTCEGVVAYVKSHQINAIYIALPMSGAPRIGKLLDDLRDTTASIYFVPDIFAFDLVQARCVAIDGIPMLSICDTPFHGLAAARKRISDVALASLALVAIWPVMLLTAIAVKLSSPGPVLFKQRRYGLNGEQIMVFKFRTMTVCEDGAVVTQATRSDRRVTRVGRRLRRTSLDELPQLLNVLRGEMSLVGPRPHAVAHNEQFRKAINGYMIRHKVRPGMTGWAQIHGLRGETSTIEAMCQRARYDLEYLSRWSMWLDLNILFKTVLIILTGRNAY
jgi:putative colanic acid biosynthesis UDP-glucose lipid carrier transferase